MTGARILWSVLLLLAAARSSPAAGFDQYQLIMWQEQTPPQIAGLKRLGFSGLKLTAANGAIDPAEAAAVRASGMSFYLENLATDLLSPYHRYTPERSPSWRFDAAKARLRRDPGDIGVFVREPSLMARDAYEARLTAVVGAYRAARPLFYNLADEAGIGDLAAAWDADMGPASLAGMRVWLRGQYADLAALNRQWGTDFADWNAIVPDTTDAAIARPDQNFSAWADFKAWMDVAFAGAVAAGRDAVHRTDPKALAGLEGAQIPGWGGYDYSLLAPSVDAMEIYDAGNAMELARAFNPDLIALRTSFAAHDDHAAWRHLLLGGRGTIVWDDAGTVVRPDGVALPRGRELAALVGRMRAVAPLLFGSEPMRDPIAVLVSQAGFRTRWILDRRAGDHRWWDRDAAREYEDNAWTAARRQILRRLEQLALAPHLLSSAMLEAGALRRDGIRVLILPHAIALSDAEVAEIQAFRQAGGRVLADTEAALFDGHSRRRASPSPAIASVPEAMLIVGGTDTPAALATFSNELPIRPRAALLGAHGLPATGISGRWFRRAGATILSLQTLLPGSGPVRIEVRVPAGTEGCGAPRLLGAGTLTTLVAGGGPSVRACGERRFGVVLDPLAPAFLVFGR